MQASLIKAALKLKSASKKSWNLHNETGKDKRDGDEDQIEQGKSQKAIAAKRHHRHQRDDPGTWRPNCRDRKRKEINLKSVEWEDTSYWKLAAAKKDIRGEETIDFEREREGAEVEWDTDQRTKEIDTTSYYRKRTQKTTSSTIRVRHEGISPQEEHKTPGKMIRHNFYQISSQLN